MSYIYFIAPVGSDSQYKLKRELLASISLDTSREFFFPLERHDRFSLESARADLRRASLTIADLSLERPSCYFELGVAQALNVAVCVIAAAGTPLHQSASPDSTQLYSNLNEYDAIVRRAVLMAP